MRSQRYWLTFALGMDVNREIPSDGEAESNLEGVGWLTYEYYKFSSPERSFKSDFFIFPGITDRGRWCARWNTNYRLEIVNDLFWKMGFYANYDNKPVSVGAAKSDYGLTTSIGYKF